MLFKLLLIHLLSSRRLKLTAENVDFYGSTFEINGQQPQVNEASDLNRRPRRCLSV